MSLAYRPEIDGFRALAVITVVLFHAGIPGFENGFIGVDIFFVISGFLITGIIAREQAGAGFSYRQFVMRRVRRILPALVVVMLACIPFAWWLMLPDPLENFGQSLVATAFSANNILLWLTTGYWDLTSDYKPLLHTWSLGVEEQFYILYPVLLVLALRMKLLACLTLMTAMAALSFVLMVRALQIDPAAGFYLLHYRAWQLLIGGIAGLIFIRQQWSGQPALAGLGLVMIVAALIPAGQPMPLVLALATLGTALYLLWGRADGATTWIFTRRPVIFVGLISYSFYLWHQPVFAFLRVGLLDYPGRLHFGLGIVLAFGLAVLSWRYIERPFRSARTTGAGTLWGFVGIGMALSVGIGLWLSATAGQPGRLNYPEGMGGAAGASVAYNERIHDRLPRTLPDGRPERPVVLIAGNSFSRDFANIVIEAGLEDHLTLLYRDDLNLCSDTWSEGERQLVGAADMLVFASGNFAQACVMQLEAETGRLGTPFFLGGNKHFGQNLNPLLRMTPERRAKIRLTVPPRIRSINDKQAALYGERYINLMDVLSEDGGVTTQVADARGVLLTTDRVHLSRAGAVFLAPHLPQLFPELYMLAGLPIADSPDEGE